jgi:hypothetical protein
LRDRQPWGEASDAKLWTQDGNMAGVTDQARLLLSRRTRAPNTLRTNRTRFIVEVDEVDRLT